MAVIPVHFFAAHDQGKFTSPHKPGSTDLLLKPTPDQMIWTYTVPCLPLENDVLPTMVTTEPEGVTCAKCRATDLWKQAYRAVLPINVDEAIAGPPKPAEVTESV